MPARSSPANPADRIHRIRLKERIHFPDLSERRALKLATLPRYTSRAHFGLWLRKFGAPDPDDANRVYTPLVYVDLESMDVIVDPLDPIVVRGEVRLARTVDDSGATRSLARDGRYLLERADGTLIARVRLLNLFTRYHRSPEKRRVTRLPDYMGLGEEPSREVVLPTVEDLLEHRGAAPLGGGEERVWNYAQTDPNRHVNGVEYIRVLEEYAATELARRGFDLSHLFLRRVQIVYRKPCFRGEFYRCEGWQHGDPPGSVSTFLRTRGEVAGARPAVAARFEVGDHQSAGG